jgi:hypothetical protein
LEAAFEPPESVHAINKSQFSLLSHPNAPYCNTNMDDVAAVYDRFFAFGRLAAKASLAIELRGGTTAGENPTAFLNLSYPSNLTLTSGIPWW